MIRRPDLFEHPPLGYTPVHCFRCGRRGLVPSRTLLTRTTRDIVCPACRPFASGPVPRSVASPNLRPNTPKPLLGRPPLILVRSKELAAIRTAGADGMVAVRCFRCGRAGRLPLRPNTSLRPEDIICPSCRPKAASDRTRSAVATEKSGRLAPNPSPVFG